MVSPGKGLVAKRILIVEDDKLLAYAWQRALGSTPFDVDVAHTLAGAKEKVASQAYDVVMLDLVLGTARASPYCRSWRK